MKGIKITYLIMIWFGLQAIFMLFWPIYLYYQTRYNFYEMLILGNIILLASLFFVSRNKKIKKIASVILWIYSVSFAFFGTMTNLVASPTITLAIVSTIIMIINLLLLTWFVYKLFLKNFLISDEELINRKKQEENQHQEEKKYPKKNKRIKKLVIIILATVDLFAVLYMGGNHESGRCFKAEMPNLKYSLKFQEKEHDSMLALSFYTPKGACNNLTIHNSSWYVIEFVIVEDIDTIFIRSSDAYDNVISPKEDSEPVVGKIPNGFKMIPFSDSRFFSFDKDEHADLPKNEKVHLITLRHFTDRNIYNIWDVTKNDTLEVKITEID